MARCILRMCCICGAAIGGSSGSACNGPTSVTGWRRKMVFIRPCNVTAAAPGPAWSVRYLSVLVAPEDPAAVVSLLAAPSTSIVSLTVTEKGYCHNPATGRLDPSHPDIVHDRAHPDAPRSAIGFIVAGLAVRRAAGLAPFVVVTCDNLPANGRLLAGLVRDFAALRDNALADWIATNAAFPSTMVDRIVPAMTPADLKDARAATGLLDAAPVSHEPFRQWVIEDRFENTERPQWELAGAQIVADVAPFEHMKLRLLNGAHSALAYLGYLAGHETIFDAVSDPALNGFVRRLWDEIVPMVPAAARHRFAPLHRKPVGTFRQSHRPPPHLANRHGRLPEAAAASARHHPRAAACRAAHPVAGADGRRVDSLRRRRR